MAWSLAGWRKSRALVGALIRPTTPSPISKGQDGTGPIFDHARWEADAIARADASVKAAIRNNPVQNHGL